MILRFTTLAILSFLFSFTSFGKVWRVNNNSGILADFNTIQAAHEGANSGDTLHLEGSPNSYGAGNFSKKLVVIGTGYFLDLNANLQANIQSSKVSYIVFYPGSEGSEITGLDFDGGYVNVFASNVTIKRNKFSHPSQYDLDYTTGAINLHYANNNSNSPLRDVEILQNYGVVVYGAWYASTGVVIMNNHLAVGLQYGGDETTTNIIDLNPASTAVIQNNVFRRGVVKAYNSSVTNNIMVAGSLTGTGNLVSNNLGSGNQFGSSNGNKVNIDMGTVFAGAPAGDAYWKLKAGSPAAGAGYGSTEQNAVDAGMYGGVSPYMLSGVPAVPSVYHISNQPIGSANDPIKVTVKVRSNH